VLAGVFDAVVGVVETLLKQELLVGATLFYCFNQLLCVAFKF